MKTQLLLFSLILVIAAATTVPAVVYAQVSPPAQRIIDLVHSSCKEDTGLTQEVDLDGCVSLRYESSTLVVLNAEMLIIDTSTGGYIENGHIWQAVDGFKAQGYQIDSVMLSGEGNQVNPHEFIVVMSK